MQQGRPELVIFVGLQGSGKSSLYLQLFAQTHRHVSKDLMPRSADKRKRQRRLLDDALAAGERVVVDNTNATRADRAELIAQARAHGARVSCYFLDATVEDCIRRNARRTGVAKVPVPAIVGTKKKLEEPVLDEGFDALFVARLDEPTGRFDVTPITGAR